MGKTAPKRYVPKHLSIKDKITQKKAIIKSQKAYKKGKYITRKKIKSFKNKSSPHIKKAQKMYNIDNLEPSKELAKKDKVRCERSKKNI
jgi:hypothetical protein